MYNLIQQGRNSGRRARDQSTRLWKEKGSGYLLENVRRCPGLPLSCTLQIPTCKGSIFWASLEKTHDPKPSRWSSVQRLGIGPRRKSDFVSGRQDLVGKVVRWTWWWQVWNLWAWMHSSHNTLEMGCCSPKDYKITFNMLFFFSKQFNFKKDKGLVLKKL